RRAVDAPRLTLQNVINELEQHIDVQAFRGLPDSYQRLVAAEPSGLIAKLLAVGSERDAVDELRRLEPILQVLDTHLILFIEDADRAGSGFDSRHLERLLFSLRSVQRISFVLSFDQTRTKIDYRKLCDVIESVPAMNVERVRRLLALTYRHWREDFAWMDHVGDRLARNALTLQHS